MESVDEHSQPYTLKNVLKANLYTHIRAYLMGLAMSEMAKNRKDWKPQTVILRGENKIAIVKGGKLELHSSDDWFKTNLKERIRREN